MYSLVTDNKIGDNQVSDSKGRATPIVSGWNDVKIWLLGHR